MRNDNTSFVDFSNHPYAIADVTENITKFRHYMDYKKVFVVHLTLININQFLSILSKKVLWNHLDCFVIITTCRMISLIFKHYWYNNIANLVVISYDKNQHDYGIRVYTSDPQAMNNRCGEDALLIHQQKCDPSLQVELPKILRKFHNCRITLSGVTTSSTSLLKMDSVTSVIRGIAKYLNASFGLAHHSLRAHKFKLALSTLDGDDDDMDNHSPVVQFDDFVWIVPAPTQMHPIEVLKVVFKTNVWLGILISYFATSILWWLMLKLKSNTTTLSSSLLIFYSLTLFGCTTNPPSRLPLKLIFMSYVVYSLHIQTAFISNLIKILTINQFEKPISTLEELVNTNHSIVILESFYYRFFNEESESENLYSKIRNKLEIYQSENFTKLIFDNETYAKFSYLFKRDQVDMIQTILKTKIYKIVDNSLTSSYKYTISLPKFSYFAETLFQLIDVFTDTVAVNSIVCPPFYCKMHPCVSPTHCREGEELAPSFCGCCSRCIRLIPRGGYCIILAGVPPASKCEDGTRFSSSVAQDELYFSQSPKNVDVVEGKSVTLPCEVAPGNGISYYWELNGSKIDNTTRRHQVGSNLHFTRVDKEKDSGEFICVAQDFKGFSVTSSPASLNIQWIGEPSVQLNSPESSSYITSGIEVVLRCHLDATGDVHVEWFRNSDRLAKSPRLEIKKRKLHIKSVNPSDNGIYRCIARNDAGIQHSVKNFALAVGGEQTALIKVVPSNQLVKKGGKALFDCSYGNADGLEWYFKDAGPLESNPRMTLYPNGSLEINRVQESDQGLYNCVGIKSDSTEVPQSYTAELKIAFIENLSDKNFEPALAEDRKAVLAEGSVFQQTCLTPRSQPLAKRYWLNPLGHTISDSGNVRVDDDGRLIIQNLQPEHKGDYKCVAENVAGRSEETIKVIVTSKKALNLANPMGLTVEENQKSVLTCSYVIDDASHPYTIIKWKKDGKVIKHDYEEDGTLNHQRIKVYKQNGTLLIHSTKPSDRGDYTCEITTAGFEPVSSKPATITVIETLKFAPPPVNKKLELGSTAKIHCKAQGTPSPVIRWEKVGSEDGFASHITDTNGTLHFTGVLNEDKGKYTCIASNIQGTINVTLNIDVVVAPKFTVLSQNPTEAIEGFSVMLHCVAEGDPKPTIHWDKNLQMNDFNLSRFQVLENGTLYIKEVHREDENNYGCTAGSSAGLNRKEIRLIVHTREGYHPNVGDGYHPNGGEGFHPNGGEAEDSTVTKAVLITMSVAAAYIILVIGLMIWCRYRRRSRKLPIAEAAKAENGDVDHTELKETANGVVPSSSHLNGLKAHKDGQKSDGTETAHSQSSAQSKKSKTSYDKILLSRTHLKDLKLIGRGEFGEIMIGKMPKSAVSVADKRNSTDTGEDKELTVMVKSLTQTKDDNALTEFKREIDLFAKITHENIVKLWGLCREVEPHYMILEYTDWGDLKQFLIATKKGSSTSLTTVQSVAVIHQLARGMEHLSSSRYVHRDLAARNCLITSGLMGKVAMPRLTKEPYSQEYCKHINNVIPLRWLPYEAVYEDEYSTKSDVYAFGVLILEIFSQGELPFPKINDVSFLTKLKEKALEWKAHKTTPPELQKLQETCWDVNPKVRPSFEDLVKETETILKSMNFHNFGKQFNEYYVISTSVIHTEKSISRFAIGYYWRDFDGTVPEDALPGGLDNTNKRIYIGQVFATYLIPAKIYTNDKNAYYEYGGKEFNVTENVKILCTQHPEQFSWISTDNHRIKSITSAALVIGGFEPGCTTYIGRTRKGGEVLVGKALADNHPDHEGLHVTQNHVAYHSSEFDVLAYTPAAPKRSSNNDLQNLLILKLLAAQKNL
ncbi:hypothetical protein FQR65_LT01332 [Abscondita terminalis]|nr:hypothetical protein FQR65_LT01332 [Abscondita terminalis]